MGLTQEVVERRLMDFESNVKDAIRSPVCRREKKKKPDPTVDPQIVVKTGRLLFTDAHSEPARRSTMITRSR